jgi:putative copper export protein
MLYLLANVVFLTDVVAAVTRASSLDDLGPPLVELATQTSYGQLWLLRMALGGVLGILLLARGNGCPSWVDGPALAVGGVLLLGFSLASHSAAVNRLAPIAVANDWLHLAAVTIWIGGLLQLAVVFARPAKVPRALGGVDPRWALLRRFGALATYALALVAITGLAEAGFHVGTLANLVGTPYGRVVALKTLLLLPLLALAAVQQGVIRPVLADQPLPALASRLLGDRRLPTWISRALLLETFWAALLLAAVGLLTSLSPP